jgi:hypothetical protein
MVYRKLKNGVHAVGFVHEGKFLAYATAFDAREAKALLKAWRAVLELFHVTSGAWITMGDGGNEIPRGAASKRDKRSGPIMRSHKRS